MSRGEAAMKGKEEVRKGLQHQLQFNIALDRLQAMGYITELYVTRRHYSLRWVKEGSCWHTTAPHLVNPLDQLRRLGLNVSFWATAVERELGNETNYAVREV